MSDQSGALTPEEWGALRVCADDGAPPKEASFASDVYKALVARGLMRVRVGRAPRGYGGGRAEFYLTTPAGAEAAKLQLCKLDVRHEGPCTRVLGHRGACDITTAHRVCAEKDGG